MALRSTHWFSRLLGPSTPTLAPGDPRDLPTSTDSTQRITSIRSSRLKLSVGLCLLTACLVAWGCRSTPVSGRKQLLLGAEESEIQMGVAAYKDVLTKEPPSKNQRYVEIVRRVGQRIAAVSERDDFQWEFNVIQSDTQNAFCLPGGKVAIYEGIMPVCESEAGLAVVMSHEIAHAIARHGGERMAHQNLKNLGGIGTGKLADYMLGESESSETKKKLILTGYDKGSEYLGILPYSRKHESEADLIGIQLLAKAGYDPSEAPRFWERFAGAKSGQQQPEWLSTHPSDARRSAELRAALPESLKLYEQAPQKFGLGDKLVMIESTNIKDPSIAGTTRLR